MQINFEQVASKSQQKLVGPVTLFGSRELSSLQLIISSKPEVCIPYIITLPFEQTELEAYTFIINQRQADTLAVQFDINPTFGTKVIGRATALAQTLGILDATSINPTTKCTCPIYDSQLRVIGHLTFDCFLVRPFKHPCLSIGGKVATYWKTTSVSNMPQGHLGVITDSSLANEYVKVCVAVTSDRIPVVHNSFWVDFKGAPVAVSALTFDQVMQIKGQGVKLDPDLADVQQLATIANSGIYQLKQLLDV